MNRKKNHSLRVPITLVTIAFIGLVFLIIMGVKLATTDLITFVSEGDTIITITKEQEYFVLLDTNGARDDIQVGFEAESNYVLVRDEENIDAATYMTLVSITSNTDTSSKTIAQIEFDKQIKTKGYLSFGKVTLEAGTYIVHSENLILDDDYGSFALLGTDYVKYIGFFSFSAISTITFALLGFKTYRAYINKPLSNYQKKHVK